MLLAFLLEQALSLQVLLQVLLQLVLQLQVLLQLLVLLLLQEFLLAQLLPVLLLFLKHPWLFLFGNFHGFFAHELAGPAHARGVVGPIR